MAGKTKKVPSINGSSTADISFIMLLFFLLTTSMGSDKGIARQLPPAPTEDQQDVMIDVNRRNMLRVLVNSNGQILANGEVMTIDQLKQKVKDFVLNPTNDPTLPELTPEDFPYIGQQMVTKNHVISLTNNVDTRYSDYIAVQNILTKAYNELRDELAQKQWNKHFEDLPKEYQEVLVDRFPQKISEAEPREYGSQKK